MRSPNRRNGSPAVGSDSSSSGYAGEAEREVSMDVREVANYLLNHCFLPSQAEDLLEKHYYAVNHLEELRGSSSPLAIRLSTIPRL